MAKYVKFMMSQTCERYGSLSMMISKSSIKSVEYFFVSELGGVELPHSHELF